MIFRSHRLDATFAVLVGLAVATVCAPSVVPGALLGNAVLLVFAAIKGRWIVLDYLGLRGSSALWRGLVLVWLVCVLAFAWAASALVFLT